MNYKWSLEELHLLKRLRATMNAKEISLEFSKRLKNKALGFRAERTPDAIHKKCQRENITKESCRDYNSKNNPYIKRIQLLNEMQAKYQAPSLVRTRGLVGEDNIARKILTLSDIHFPFARNDLLKAIIEEHSDADICVLNGDIYEGYAASRWPKAKRINALIEYRCVLEFVKLCSEIFPQVYLVDGNHDIRTAANLKDSGFEKERSQVLRPNLMARIANGEVLDETGMLVDKLDFSNVHYEQRESWYVRIGKTIFAHPWNKGGAAPGYSVRKVNDFFNNRYSQDDYDSIVIGHTHKVYKGVVNSRLLIEQGCLAGLMGYAFSPRMKFGTDNGMNGYAVIYQDEAGNTDFNWSGPVFLGEVLPPKKSVLI